MSKLKDCANTIKCIGTISEILIDFIPKQDNIILKGSIVLHVNDSYIRFNFFTNKKMKNEYYDMIELFGIPYEYIKSIDKDKYTLFEFISPPRLLYPNSPSSFIVVDSNTP